MVTTPKQTSLVLIADEDREIRKYFRDTLEADNLTIIEAPDSESCELTCRHLRPDLVLLSVGFPNAFDLCNGLKKTPDLQQIRILILLDEESQPILEQLYAAGADDYLVKPIYPPVLLNRVHSVLREQTLEMQVAFQREILSQMADGVVAVDSNDTVIYWNREAERAYQISAEEILGNPLAKAFQVEWPLSLPLEEVTRITDQQGEWRGEVVHVKRDGERRDVEVSARVLKNEDQLPFGYIGVIRDITERKQIEAALQEQRELADALRDTASALVRTLDPPTVMRSLLDHLGRVVPTRTANIMLLEGDNAHVAYSQGYSSEEQAAIDKAAFSLADMPTFQQMLNTGQSCLIGDTQQYLDWTYMPEVSWVRSYLGAPIRAYDHIIGFLNLDSDVPNAFTPVHAERLRAFADQAAIAVENAQLYDAIYHDALELRALHRATGFLYMPNLFTSDNIVDMCEQVVGVVINEFGKLDCGVMLVDEMTRMLVRVARKGEFQVHAVRPLHVDGPGLIPEAVRTGKVVYAPNVMQHPSYFPSNPQTMSELVVPLRTSKGVIGALDLQSGDLDAFDEHERRVLEVFAERAAIAIDNVKLYNAVHRYTTELETRVDERTAELNRVKQRAEAILNNSSDAIFLVHTDGTIQQTNHTFDKVFGYDSDESFGKYVQLIFESGYRDLITDALDRVLDTSEPERLEVVAERANGSAFDADMMLSPVCDANSQKITSIVCSLRDITQRKRLELDLRDALYKERELNELKTQFIARASHEFRTPLAVILTASDLLKNYHERMTKEQRDEKLNRLQNEVRGIAIMLDDLLTLSRNEELKEFNPDLIDLGGTIEKIVHEMDDGIGIQHQFNFDVRGACGSAYADKKLIRYIIVNLLSNAVKYSESGSTIKVKLTCEASSTILTISDEGIGILPEDQLHLFEAFHRGKNAEHLTGTGLGLAIVKQAVELHGGEVSFTSEVGKGTTFKVVLPNLALKETLQ